MSKIKLEQRLRNAFFTDENMMKFFKSQNTKNMSKDSIIDISKTTFQMDLMSMPIDPSNGFRYALVLVNISNNHIYTEATEKKDADSVLFSFKRIMERQRPNIKTLQTDHGTEFENKKMKDYCKKKEINLIHYNLYNKNTMSIVEAMNGLISKMIYIHLSILTLKKTEVEKKTGKTPSGYNTSWVGLLKKATAIINAYNYEKYGEVVKHTIKDLIDSNVKYDGELLKNGTTVYLRKQKPESIIDGKKFFGSFRHGDVKYDYLNPKTITDHFIKSGRPIRYFLDNDKSISYKRQDFILK